jgi:valyl-tRNA synthetase
MAGYRAFGNKIWNATRFALSRLEGAEVQPALDTAGLAAPERWILSRLSRTAAEVGERLEAFRFDEACHRLYHFFWGELCDWYIELAKPALFGEAPRPRVGEVLLTVLDRSFRLLHPVMPFLTEELWQRLPGHERSHPETIVLAPYPGREAQWEDEKVEEQVGTLIHLVTRVRALRAESGLPPKAAVTIWATKDPEADRFLAEQEPLIRFLCRAEALHLAAAPPEIRQDIVEGITVGLALPQEKGLGEEERRRLEKELEKLDEAIGQAEQRLGDERFTAKAPPQVVAGNRARLAEMQERRERILATLEPIGTAGG